jgi:hypothetical protein
MPEIDKGREWDKPTERDAVEIVSEEKILAGYDDFAVAIKYGRGFQKAIHEVEKIHGITISERISARIRSREDGFLKEARRVCI